MQQLIPSVSTFDDPTDVLAADSRVGPGTRPWVMTNMISSIDGAYAVRGRSGALGGDADHAVFHALRGLADVVLVAAGTARAERYRRPGVTDSAKAVRDRLGLWPVPRLAMVSRRLDLPDDLPLLGGDGPDPLLFHPRDANTSGVPNGLELRPAGVGSVDLGLVLDSLAADGAGVVLCEGGPTLLGQLHAEDLIDEYFLTLSPAAVGGESVGMMGRSEPHLRAYDLHRAIEDSGFLLLTYRRRRDA